MHTPLSFPLAGEDVLITGAGPIGLKGVDLAVNVARERVAAAQQGLGMAEGFDIGLEMSGSPGALPEMLENLNYGARVAVLGLPSQAITIDWAKVVTHMITIKGIHGREIFETWYAMNAMVSTGLDISPVITDRFPASRWEAAFAAARNGDRGKIIIDWSGEQIAVSGTVAAALARCKYGMARSGPGARRIRRGPSRAGQVR